VRFSDNGIGMDPEILAIGSRENHFGLTGMRGGARNGYAVGFSYKVNRVQARGLKWTVPAAVAYADARKWRYSFMRSRVLISEE